MEPNYIYTVTALNEYIKDLLDSDAGLAALTRFLEDRAQALAERPVFTDAEITAYYQAKKREELTPPPGE